ncbi:hypothetical protein BKA58DRAFT_78261 [Alternaria rosae]|uniref:uncharacterized protein n=1 Tax=Alternaria rosae TaxID=1187941 RepID=UPI001E8D71BC|nr:uncharacterized protein BKA58DRAFT_78261 [Alternaria rosae]KAH6877602.1 hypothetical protein BKA58DRAFT_78261 [Alternaria rosae]
MSKQDPPMQSVWQELWRGNLPLYLAMNLSTTANIALVTLLLVAILSITFEVIRIWLFRRTRQTHSYVLVDDTVEISPPSSGPVSLLARTSHGPRPTVYAKAILHAILFLGVQAVLTLLVVQIARLVASTFATDRRLRKQCYRLAQRGLECPAATRYHSVLNVTVALGLFYLIRGLQLHADLPTRPSQNSNYSNGFLSLQDTCRRAMQKVLAAPITVVVLHSRVSGDEPWKHARLILVQVAVSVCIFLCGNFLCLLAALPDIHGTILALEKSGLTGKTEV